MVVVVFARGQIKSGTWAALERRELSWDQCLGGRTTRHDTRMLRSRRRRSGPCPAASQPAPPAASSEEQPAFQGWCGTLLHYVLRLALTLPTSKVLLASTPHAGPYPLWHHSASPSNSPAFRGLTRTASSQTSFVLALALHQDAIQRGPVACTYYVATCVYGVAR